MPWLIFPPGTVAEIEKVGGDWVVVGFNEDPIRIWVEDLDGDGTISNDEWDPAFTGNGNDLGDTNYAFSGTGSSGQLYYTGLGAPPYSVGDDVSDIYDSLDNDFELDIDEVVCFTPGAIIATRTGLRPVETLRVGDWVQTRDNGFQKIRWIGRRRIASSDLQKTPSLRPILIRKDAFGPGRPGRDLQLSPQHRILINDWRASYLFDQPEVLASATSLRNDLSVVGVSTCQPVEYIHFMFDRHEVVLSNNLWTESFLPTGYSLSVLDAPQRDELFTLFPELRNHPKSFGQTARLTPPTRHSRLISKL